MTEAEIAAAVAAKLTGEIYLGAQVEVLSNGKRGIIKRIRRSREGTTWLRVVYLNTGGHWEYIADQLRLL